MKVIETKLKGCYIIEPQKFEDSRGYFFESFNSLQFNKVTGTNTCFVQDNQSYSNYGVIRGLHAQGGNFAQAKLVRVLAGRVLDVAVDVRPNSSTYGEYVAVELSSSNNKQFFIPKGFLHGFSVLSETATFFYKCDNYYNKESEYGVVYNDKTLNIDWGIEKEKEIVSDKDILLPNFIELVKSNVI